MTDLITIEEAQAKLPEIIDKLEPGEELIITRNDWPIAKLVGYWRPARKPRQLGSAKGMLTIVSDDDEHLKDFAAVIS
jgi:antitoxin (DNA-binding transcriptional repressor) of toxin-antitoxin stability system